MSSYKIAGAPPLFLEEGGKQGNKEYIHNVTFYSFKIETVHSVTHTFTSSM